MLGTSLAVPPPSCLVVLGSVQVAPRTRSRSAESIGGCGYALLRRCSRTVAVARSAAATSDVSQSRRQNGPATTTVSRRSEFTRFTGVCAARALQRAGRPWPTIKCHRASVAKLLRVPADIGCSLLAARTSSFPSELCRCAEESEQRHQHMCRFGYIACSGYLTRRSLSPKRYATAHRFLLDGCWSAMQCFRNLRHGRSAFSQKL